MKRFVRLMLHFFIGLEVLDDGPTFSGMVGVIKTDYSFICKHRETVEAKIIASKPLQRSQCNEAVPSHIFNSFLVVSSIIQTDGGCLFVKIFKNRSLGNLYSIYPQRISPYITRKGFSF